MKLSEAIREGAKIRPMARGAYFKWNRDEGYCSCALGAAYEAIKPLKSGKAPKDEFKITGAIETKLCPGLTRIYCASVSSAEGALAGPSLLNIVSEMNDSGKFTREEIADWLESIGE